jgi:large subunit ribosomal protein L9
MAQIQLILNEDVPNLGDAGDVVKVKPGFARNFLLPQGKAILATKERVAEVEHHKRVIAERVAREMKNLAGTKKAMEKLVLEIEMQAGSEGRLFGSVTNTAIAELLAVQGYEVDRRKITLSEPIKTVGDHKVPVKLKGTLVAEVKLTVKPASGSGAAAASDEAAPAPAVGETSPDVAEASGDAGASDDADA